MKQIHVKLLLVALATLPFLVGCQQEATPSSPGMSPQEERQLAERAAKASETYSESPEMCRLRTSQANTILDVIRSYSLSTSDDDFRLGLEHRIFEQIENLYWCKDGIDKIEDDSHATEKLAGELLMFSGWNPKSGDQLLGDLKRFAQKNGTENLKEPLFEQETFVDFLDDVVKSCRKQSDELSSNWPPTWPKKPDNWNGIKTPR
jgi:hypothetical protein